MRLQAKPNWKGTASGWRSSPPACASNKATLRTASYLHPRPQKNVNQAEIDRETYTPLSPTSQNPLLSQTHDTRAAEPKALVPSSRHLVEPGERFLPRFRLRTFGL